MKNKIPPDNYIVEIWRKGSNIPLIQYGLNLFAAESLYYAAPNSFVKRQILDGNNNGLIIREENK